MDSQKILVYLIGSLGDTIVAIPALRAIREYYRQAELVLLQNSQADGVVSASEVIPSGLVDRFVSYKSGGLTAILNYAGLWSKLRAEKFDAVVYLVISERPAKSVVRDRRFFRACGIRKLVGFHAFSRDELYPIGTDGRPAITKHESLRKLDRLERDGLTVDRDTVLTLPFFEFSPKETEKMRLSVLEGDTGTAVKLAAIAPSCKTVSNRWTTDNFVRVAAYLSSKGFEIVIVGGPPDRDLGAEIVDKLGSGTNTAGKFTVRESALLLSICDLYVGLDTGSTHLASAVGTPCFAIFGERNNPGHWFPSGRSLVISHPVKCSGCRQFECPVEGHPCMSEMAAENVIRHLDRFIASNFEIGEKFVTI